MRKGRLHNIFEIDKKPGLSNYLSGIIEAEDKEDISNYIKMTNIPNLYVMPSGDVPPNPSELLGLERTSHLIDELKEKFDIIIFDGTPSLIVTDALILARQVDATLIVTAYKSTKMGDVEKIKKSIENVGGNIIGMVLNKIPISEKKYESSYYYGHKKENRNEHKIEYDGNRIQERIRIEEIKHKEIEGDSKTGVKQEKKMNLKRGINLTEKINQATAIKKGRRMNKSAITGQGRRARNQREK